MPGLPSALRALSLMAPMLLACNGGGGPPPIDSGPVFDAPWSPSCIEAMDHSDFDWINTEIFNKACANFTSCHQGNNPAGDLNMLPTRGFDELVNVPSASFGDWLRVKPCSPEESYLMVRLRCYSESDEFGMSCEPGPLDGGTLMPPNSRPICGPKIEAIRRWILNGAPEVGSDSTCGADAGEDAAGSRDAGGCAPGAGGGGSP